MKNKANIKFWLHLLLISYLIYIFIIVLTFVIYSKTVLKNDFTLLPIVVTFISVFLGFYTKEICNHIINGMHSYNKQRLEENSALQGFYYSLADLVLLMGIGVILTDALRGYINFHLRVFIFFDHLYFI